MKPSRVTIHCTASKDGFNYPASQIDSDHKARGWKGIGYHFVIQPSGSVEEGRPLDEIGAHVQGDNKDNIGIALVGTNKFTLSQFKALRMILEALDTKFKIHGSQIFGHYEFLSAKEQGKTCPNMRITNVVLWYYFEDESFISEWLL